jgi:hypothetical protein
VREDAERVLKNLEGNVGTDSLFRRRVVETLAGEKWPPK